ncbi:short-chain dehydrogenase [Aspergillus ruber CBS 135680]|uniref:Short-chain dehydrogenase n=1 Tax=Aspergillus ruber (strain CBS 135680) TaxID=1388766 RepID=A0A017SJP8_ASPRC|nr:short-chain dehydrogenase [Aspergillus ruber CBS 135680]EYE97178.1 short-chain dehydrogenase [Aspergillus ruber CBS 135680]
MRRTAIVTGSVNGIGRAIATRLVRDRYSVCINDIPNKAAEIEALVTELNTIPSSNVRPKVIGVPADVTSGASVEAMIRETVGKLGPLTLMVANAGIAQTKPLFSVTEEDVDDVFSVNVKGVFNCYTRAVQQMIAQGDPETVAGVRVYKILGAASIAGLRASAPLGAYSASKFAVRGLTQAFAQECAPHKITVNAYAPGLIDTLMLDGIDESLTRMSGQKKGDMKRNYTEQMVALGRSGTPEDVAGVVGGYLASPDSDYTTGQTSVVDGDISDISPLGRDPR